MVGSSPDSLPDSLPGAVVAAVQPIDMWLLRYETEYTPCTGITAVTKQERRYFPRAAMIAPWCPLLVASQKALDAGKVSAVRGECLVGQQRCGIRVAHDDWSPLIFLDCPGRFQGRETPYDTPDLKTDALFFGQAVNAFIRLAGDSRQFVWGADWQSVPALVLLRDRHMVSLTLHNTFDECLAKETAQFGADFAIFQQLRPPELRRPKTALEVGLELADVVTTVNRGFAHGIRTEPIQRLVMAKHLQPHVHRIVGINNAHFATLSDELLKLESRFRSDFTGACDDLRRIRQRALTKLPPDVERRAREKVILVSMGRRVGQKLHEVLCQSLRRLLRENRDFPVLAVFPTVHGDAGSAARLEVIRSLATEFPEHVLQYDGQLPFYAELMAAADYNCMPSLYEPHGGAFSGTVVPIARAIDGLAEQICGLDVQGPAAELNSLWHAPSEPPSGWLFREPLAPDSPDATKQLAALLTESPAPENSLFNALVNALTPVLRRAVELRLQDYPAYARLVAQVLAKQRGESWLINLGGMLALIEEARVRRTSISREDTASLLTDLPKNN